MPSFTLLICRKDLRLTLRRGQGLVQSLLLGILLLFVFNLAQDFGEHASPREAAAIFWLSSVFCQALIYNHLYALEEMNSVRECLILAPRPLQAIWLGKCLGGAVLLLIAQLFFLPATVVFLGQDLGGPVWPGLCGIGLADIGLCALGSLLGALGQGQTGRESLLSIIFFPLLTPLLMAGTGLLSISFGTVPSGETGGWLGIAAAFDAIFIGAGLTLFGFLYQGET